MNIKVAEVLAMTPDAVVAKLKELYPNELPLHPITEFEHGKSVGIQLVIRMLEHSKRATDPGNPNYVTRAKAP